MPVAKAKARPRTPEDVGPEWAQLLRLLPGYDPFRDAGDCWFDGAAARRAIDFIHECIRHVEGSLAGQPFLMQPWQQCFVANLFGWKRTDRQGRTVRRYREALLYVPRKNGKTPLAAAIALLVFFLDNEKGQQGYVAAGDREQAALLFRQAQGMVTQEPELARRCRIYGGAGAAGQSRSLVRESDNSFLRVISADAETKHGGNSSLVIIDELHVQPDRDLVDVLTTSMASLNRAQPLLLSLTTADFDRASICNEKHDYARKVRDGLVLDPHFLPAVYEAGVDEDWTDPAVWAKANPNLGVSVSEEYLQRECAKAKDNPAYENTFRRLHLNTKTQQDVRWLAMEAWDACAGAVDEEALRWRDCYGGLDLASTSDLCAFVLDFPGEDNTHDVLAWFWLPEAALRRRERANKTRLDQWVRAGLIETTPGDVTDYSAVRARIQDLNRRFMIREIAYDRWNASQLIIELSDADGIGCVGFGQGFASMSGPTKELGNLVLAGKVRHGGNPVLRWMASNVTVKEDPAGNLKPDKSKSSEKIDGVVALVMALGRAMLRPVPSTYDTKGVEVI